MKISEIGEFGLIDMISGIVDGHKDKAADSWKRLILGIGDDAALWKGSTRAQIATTDSLVEDVHFSLKYCKWESLGWKALAVNLSDIASMGGYPLYAFVSLSLPGHIEVQDIASFYKGMLDLCLKSGTAIAGGNLSGSRKVVITLTVTGEAEEGKVLLRSVAEPGDLVAVTGYTGLSAAGLKVLQGKVKVTGEADSFFREAFLRPEPRLKEAHFLAGRGIKTAIDVSDGLLKDLDHICESSKVEAEININSIPLHPFLEKYFGRKALSLAMSGGEDYELIFTVKEKTVPDIKKGIGCPVAIIGKVTGRSSRGKLIVKDEKNRVVTPKKGGWDHFR